MMLRWLSHGDMVSCKVGGPCMVVNEIYPIISSHTEANLAHYKILDTGAIVAEFAEAAESEAAKIQCRWWDGEKFADANFHHATLLAAL